MRVTCAAILAGLYAGPLLFVSAMRVNQLLNDVAGTFGGGSHNRFELNPAHVDGRSAVTTAVKRDLANQAVGLNERANTDVHARAAAGLETRPKPPE